MLNSTVAIATGRYTWDLLTGGFVETVDEPGIVDSMVIAASAVDGFDASPARWAAVNAAVLAIGIAWENAGCPRDFQADARLALLRMGCGEENLPDEPQPGAYIADAIAAQESR